MLGEMINIFCFTEEQTPTMQEILELLSEEGFDIHFEDEAGLSSSEMEDPSWAEAVIVYSSEAEPINIECWRDDESDEFDDIRDEKIEEILNSGVLESDKLIEHLKHCNFVINILPMSEPDEESEDVFSAIFNFLNGAFQGLAVVDETGVYDGDELILEFN